MSAAILSRTAFTTDRTLEFFTEAELTTQLGYGRALWPLVLVKELIDNALDACESSASPPEISIALESDALIVSDNGPGIPAELIERSLDYRIRVSDKKHYVAPTRGQLGNALKCVWAAPFIVDGERGLVEVETRGIHHRIEARLNRLAQKPRISHTTEPSVRNGTSVKIHWLDVASCKTGYTSEFYRGLELAAALEGLVTDFAAFNPHASFTFNELSFPATDPAWEKWRTDQPTSAHWYKPADLRALIAAYVTQADRPVRDFLQEFAKLSGTQVRKTVLAEAAIAANRLSDLVVDGDIDMTVVKRLLAAMQRNSKPIKPERLGIIGKEHLEAVFAAAGADGFTYDKVTMVDDEGLPCVIEIAFGTRTEGGLRKIIGLNWSPVFKTPSGAISDALNNCRVQSCDPVILLIHQARPRFAFTDHGKGALAA